MSFCYLATIVDLSPLLAAFLALDSNGVLSLRSLEALQILVISLSVPPFGVIWILLIFLQFLETHLRFELFWGASSLALWGLI